MAESRQAVIRADASAAIGGGHVMRCLALSQALMDEGWQITFAGTAETRSTVPALTKSPYGWHSLQCPGEAAELVAARPEGCDLVVIDHYDLDISYETACRPWARRIMVIDDLADRNHDCDILLDQTLERTPVAYRRLLPSNARQMLGPEFALLRKEFAARRLTSAVPGAQVQRVVLIFGTTDPSRSLESAMAAVRASLPTAVIDVVVGSAAPHLSHLRAAAEETDSRLQLDVANMANLLARADIVVAAAGSVVWEACALARPLVLVSLADNQRNVAASLQRHKAAVLVDRIAHLADAVAALAGNAVQRRALASAAGRICDGRGARRVAINLSPERSTDGREVSLRPVRMTDAEMLLAWQQEPETRRYARNAAIPTQFEHMAWMRQKLADPGCLFNLILHGNSPAGVIRLDHRGAADQEIFEVSIFVPTAQHRLGLGRAALRLVRRLVPEAVLLAQIHPENEASHALFAGAGYVANGAWYRSDPWRVAGQEAS